MKNLIEVIGVFIIGGVMAVIMNVAAQDAKTSADTIPEPTPAAESAPASSPYARNVDCPKCGQGYRVVGNEPHRQIACDCGATLNLAEDAGGSLVVSSVESAVSEVVDMSVEDPITSKRTAAAIERTLQGVIRAERAFNRAAVKIINPNEGSPEVAGPPPEVNWFTDQETARAQAIRTGKPLLVFATKSSGCPPCERVKKYVFSDPRVVERLNKDFVCCLVVDKVIFPGINVSYPSMWLRLPSGAGFMWSGSRSPVPEEPAAFLAALDKALR